MTTTKLNFIFLGDLLSVENDNKFNIVETYCLKKADIEQIKIIKKFLKDYQRFTAVNYFEHVKKGVKDGLFKGGFEFIPLEKKKWNYWVIEHKYNQLDDKFAKALNLSTLDLTILFESFVVKNEYYGNQHNRFCPINFFLDYSPYDNEIKLINQTSVKEISDIYKMLEVFESKKNQFDFIQKSLSDFQKLKEISNSSPFKILSYFSILELLLTSGKLKRTHDDSINMQLQKKIKLLNNRFDKPLNFTEFFKGPDSNTLETIIEKLYQYRSDIAHGNFIDFEKELAVFKKSRNNIGSFLYILLKKILIKSLYEPQLLKDLREC